MNLIGPGMTRVAVSYGGTGGPNGKKEDKRQFDTIGKEIKAPPPPFRAESLTDRETNAPAA